MSSKKGPMRVVALFSGGASAVKYLFESDPAGYGKIYAIVGAFTDNAQASGIAVCRNAGIHVDCLDYKYWCEGICVSPKDLEARKSYFAEVNRWIKMLQPDLIMLSGFQLIITEPLLSEWTGTILNVHPADLRIEDAKGRRRYTGLNAVAKAIAAGERGTRSTVHIVTAEVDGGLIVAVSDPLPVVPGRSPKDHQEVMKWACDGPAYAQALHIMSERLTKPE